jgi:hypothetical protein
MKKIITIIILFIGLNTIAQTKFEKGYFITLDSKKTECLIKNEDWINTPKNIYYKLKENSEVNKISQKQLKVIEINNKLLLERHNVDINRYSNRLSELSSKRTSNFNKENLFLKVLLVGKARLLKYSSNNVDYFFT